jgi:hypothetical protein
MPAVFVQGPGGSLYFPRLESYNSATNTATFVMLNGLPSGPYQLHLSGPGGLTDLAGNPLVGNQPGGGDFVYSFSVHDAIRDPGTDPLVVFRDRADNGLQDIGPLFAQELMVQGTSPTGAPVGVGVTVTRDFAQHPVAGPVADSQDVYRIQLLYFQQYAFTLTNQSVGTTAGLSLVVSTDPQGLHVIPNEAIFALNPGTYYLHVSGWKATDAAKIKYQIHIVLLGSAERPTPLTIGAAPAIRIQIASSLPPPPAPGGVPAGPSGGGIPSGILLALGAGALGGTATGVPGESRSTLPGLDVLDRVVAIAPRFLREEEVVQLVSLIQTPEDDVGENPVAQQAPATTGNLTDLPGWEQAMDLLYQLWTTLERELSDVSGPEQASPSDGEDVGPELQDIAVDLSDTGLWALAAPALFAGAFQLPPPKSEKRNPQSQKRTGALGIRVSNFEFWPRPLSL